MADGITKRVGKRGITWQARVDLGPDPVSGARRQVMETFGTQTAARAWRRERIAERDRGGVAGYDRRPLTAYLAVWAAGEHRWRRSTHELYARWQRLYIDPTIGHIPLCVLRPIHIHDLLHTTLARRGLSAATRRKVYSVLHHALADAERLELVARNVAARVEAPVGVAREPGHWTAAQARAFLAALDAEPLRPLWLLAVHTGMRRGELCGLRWCDMDLSHGTLRIMQQVTPCPGGKETGPPKTRGSERQIALSSALVEELRTHRAMQEERRGLLANRWCEHGLVFCADDGRPLHPSTVTDRFALLCSRTGLPRIRLHDLRHTASSLLHELGIPLRTTADLLGHSTLVMTAAYTHADLAGQRVAAAALASLLASPCVENEEKQAAAHAPAS